MRMADVTQRVAGLGGDKWDVHFAARARKSQGADIIELTIGEPDVPVSPSLIDRTKAALDDGRTGYSNGQGEPGLLAALAAQYSVRRGRRFEPANFLCFPGTQTALYAVMMGMAQAGDEVLVGDPMYATYEGVIRATGADMVPVPLRAEHGFRLRAADVAARITLRTRVLFLTTPHNPTGAVLSAEDLTQLGDLARRHDFWILSDEVYEDLTFEGTSFASPLDLPQIADRVVAVSSISKSHAAPGFRSGWCVGPAAFCDRLLPLSETMLFGNQPFIADMTEKALRDGSDVAEAMAQRFAARAARLTDRLHRDSVLTTNNPAAGMFSLVNTRGLGMTGEDFAWRLLEAGVAVMPGRAFGEELTDWIRVSLTVPDTMFETALDRICACAQGIKRGIISAHPDAGAV